MRRLHISLLALGLALGGAGLAGCGKVGLLEQPAPMWGQKAKAEYKAQQNGHPAAATPGATEHEGVPDATPPGLAPPEPGAATPVPSPPTPAPPEPQ
jgi:hypothetical protein